MQSTCGGHLVTFAYNYVPKVIKSASVSTQSIDNETMTRIYNKDK